MKQIDVQLMHPKEQITKVIGRIYKYGMTTTSGGNISIRDEKDTIWITPSGIDKGSITEKDISRVSKNGKISGKHEPSSEFLFHKAIYQTRHDIKAIIHAHPPALVSFSIVRQVPDTTIIPSAKIICGPVGYAPYGLPGSEELGNKIAVEFTNNDHLSVIMENHGVVVGGRDILDALARLETLEHTAQTIINAKIIDKPICPTNKQIQDYENQLPNSFSEYHKDPESDDEQLIRQDICKIIHRACAHGLISSTSGTVSKRSENNDFLITPSNFIRWDIQPDELVNIKDGKSEEGKIPDRYVSLHQKIYRTHKHINSIIVAQPTNVMAFGITNTKFDIRTIPESWIFLQDIPRVSFGSQFLDKKSITGLLSSEVPALLISNDSFLVTGDKLIQTFDKLEVAEFSAKSLVMATSLGNFVPINQDQIKALREKFLK